jgi:Tfp pilus assembly protein PilV
VRERGFAIIEVAMATFVLAFGIATATIVLQTGFKALNVARDSTLASQIIQSEIERLRLWPWSKSSPASTIDSITELPTSDTVSLSTMFSASTALASKFTVTRTVLPDGSRPDDVRYITVTVSWKSYDGRDHTRAFTTMYAKNGLYDYYYTLASS